MKITILKPILLIAVVSILNLSCNNSPKAKEDILAGAKEDVVVAKADLAKSTLDSIRDFNKYKESIEKKLVENEKVIAALKSKNTSENHGAQVLFSSQLDMLELKNKKLSQKIKDYKQGPEQKWELFKVDFNKDMDELGKSISTLAERNMKK